MRKYKISGLLIFTIVFFFLSCKKEEPYILETPNYIDDYFVPTNGEYFYTEFPSKSSDTTGSNIDSVAGSHFAISAEKKKLLIYAGDDIKTIFIGISGKYGYYSVSVDESMKKSGGGIEIELDYKQKTDIKQYNIMIAALNIADETSDFFTYKMLTTESGIGKLYITCTWNESADIDLHLVEPNGESINHANRKSANAGVLSRDSNPMCWVDSINVEEITYDSTAFVEQGEYIVKTQLYSLCNTYDTAHCKIQVKYINSYMPSKNFSRDTTIIMKFPEYTEPKEVLRFNIITESAIL